MNLNLMIGQFDYTNKYNLIHIHLKILFIVLLYMIKIANFKIYQYHFPSNFHQIYLPLVIWYYSSNQLPTCKEFSSSAELYLLMSAEACGM